MSKGSLFARVSAAIALSLIVSVAACKTAPKKEETSELANPNAAVDDSTLGDSDSGKAAGLKTIHFPYDSIVLSSEAKSDLKNNAEIMKAKTSLRIQIEGHADQRGGIQYNIALGEKRANSVKKFMEELGITGDRLTTISYGKERPIDSSTTEEAYSKNRRANFVITTK